MDQSQPWAEQGLVAVPSGQRPLVAEALVEVRMLSGRAVAAAVLPAEPQGQAVEVVVEEAG